MSDELDELEDELSYNELVEFHIDDGSLKLTYEDDDLETKSEVIFLGNISSCLVTEKIVLEEEEVSPTEGIGHMLLITVGPGVLLVLLCGEQKNARDTIVYYIGLAAIAFGILCATFVYLIRLMSKPDNSDKEEEGSIITIQKNSGRDLVLEIPGKEGARRMTEEIESAIMLHQQTNVTTDNAVQMGVVPQQTSPKPSVPPAVDTQFLVAINKEQWGPYDVAQLQQMINQGSLQRDTLVWNQSMPKWTMACEVPELTGLFGPPPIPD